MGHPSLELLGKTAVVIGGTRGLGSAIADALSLAGARIIVASRRKESLEQSQAAFTKQGRSVTALTCDATDIRSVEDLRAECIRSHGQIHILVNCAGKTKRKPFLDFSDEEWTDILNVNLNSTIYGCRVFGKDMVEKGYGRIINIASLSSYVALYQVAPYSASKSAVASLTKSLAVEWSRFGVCVNALLPGNFRTDMNKDLLDGTERGREFLIRTPMGRFGQLNELAGAAVFLASDAASYVTGHLLAVDGGFLASGVNQ